MWSKGNNTSSTCYLYTGSICEAFLVQWYECATSRKGSMRVSVSRQMQMNHENTLETLGQFLGNVMQLIIMVFFIALCSSL